MSTIDTTDAINLFMTMFQIAFWCSMMIIAATTVKIAYALGSSGKGKRRG
jgi:Na+-driven multidrug efflux pump